GGREERHGDVEELDTYLGEFTPPSGSMNGHTPAGVWSQEGNHAEQRRDQYRPLPDVSGKRTLSSLWRRGRVPALWRVLVFGALWKVPRHRPRRRTQASVGYWPSV